MRTLEDWFKYLEQQYVDERASRQEQQEEPAPSPSEREEAEGGQGVPAPLPEPTPVAAMEEEQELPPASPEARTEEPAEPPALLSNTALPQLQVEEVTVPDPAEYIFSLRRHAEETSSVEQAAASGEAEPAECEETPEMAEAVAEGVAEASPEAVTEPVETSPEPPSEEAAPAPVVSHTTRAKPAKRAPYTRSVKPVPPPQSIEELWQRVPKHVRLLVELGDDEVTQKYYDRRFKESRRELVERLLNPSLTLEDTARLLGVCPTTVRRYTERGLLNHYRTPGNQRRFRLSDVIAFLEARQQAQEKRRRKR